MPDASVDLHKQSRAVSQAADLILHNHRKVGMREPEMRMLTAALRDASDSLALAAGSTEASRIIGEFRPS